ncbi:MAG: hypothetical protein Sapg2KO_31390 [Saprospiraceae bacterium]
MENSNQSFLEKAQNPIIQAIGIYLGVLVMIAGGAMVKGTGLMPVSERFPWMCAAAFMLFFAMFNSVFALSSPNINKYWGKSIYSFLGLAALAGFTAWITSSLSINEAGSFRWIYIVVTIGYMIFLSMVTMMRTIVDFAQREEWSQPKIRQKPRNNSERNRHIK